MQHNVIASTIFAGKIYNPGFQELEEEVALELRKRGALDEDEETYNAKQEQEKQQQEQARQQVEDAAHEEGIYAQLSDLLDIERVPDEPKNAFMEQLLGKVTKLASGKKFDKALDVSQHGYDSAVREGKRADEYDLALEVAAAKISGELGIERSSEESALSFIERFADKETPELANRLRPMVGISDLSEPEKVETPLIPAPVIPTSNGLSQAVNEALFAKFGDAQGIARATDQELIDIKGIAEGNLAKARAAYPLQA